MDLSQFIRDFAAALKTVDARRPVFTSRTGRVCQPWIGSHSEDRAVDLILAEMKVGRPTQNGKIACRLPYPHDRLATSCSLVNG